MMASVEPGMKELAVLCILRTGADVAQGQDEALLLLRRNKEPNRGLYVPVGGHVDPYESPRAAALREVREETGLALDDVQFRGVLIETSPTAYNWVSFVYSADVERFRPPECREGTLRWVAVDQLHDLPAPPTDRHIYEHVARGEPFVFDTYFDAELSMTRMVEELSGRVVEGE
jgi:8-oxo-dGTP diphosphatase